MVHPLLFWSLSALTVAGALAVILARHPMYAVLSLVVTLFGLSGLFIGLEAFFVAVIQVLVYAGAVLVLFIFVVMLLDIAPEQVLRIRSRTMTWIGLPLGGLFLWQVIEAVKQFSNLVPKPPMAGSTAEIGKQLFTTYALPFEVASALLLVGVIGAIVLAKRKIE